MSARADKSGRWTAVIEIEEQSKIIANKNYENIEDFDRDVAPYVSDSYKKASFFLRVVMCEGSARFKELMFKSEVVSKFIKDNGRFGGSVGTLESFDEPYLIAWSKGIIDNAFSFEYNGKRYATMGGGYTVY